MDLYKRQDKRDSKKKRDTNSNYSSKHIRISEALMSNKVKNNNIDKNNTSKPVKK